MDMTRKLNPPGNAYEGNAYESNTVGSSAALLERPVVETTEAPEAGKSPKKAAMASLLGSTLEYYDFVIYGTASALLFSQIFFPEGNPAVATIASLASFGVAYIARPIGGLVMGHVGDRISRKTALMITLLIMGAASIAIGLLPTYGMIGIWATVLLFVCRVAQGFSAGAESAGASTLTMEHSPEGRRGLFTSSVMVGCAAGNVLAGLVFIPFLMLPEEHLMTWGWRVPFLLSAVVLLVAYFIRTRLEEPEVLKEAIEETSPTDAAVHQAPAIAVLQTQGIDVLKVFFITFFSVVQTIFNVYALAYATGEMGIERSLMVTVNTLAMGLSLFTIPLAAWVSDKVGRRPVLLFSAVGSGITTFFYFQAISEVNVPLIFLFCILNQGLFYACWNGVWTIFFPEMFAAPVRYTGMAMGNQLGLIVVGFAPSIATALHLQGGWIAVVLFVLAALTIASVTILTCRETAFTPMKDLGRKRPNTFVPTNQ